MKKIRKSFIGILVLAALIWVFFEIKKMPSFTGLFTPKKVVIENSPVVVKQIQSLAQLATISMYDEIVADTSQPDIKSFQLPLLPSLNFYNSLNRLVIIGQVTVHIGINMQYFNAEDVSRTADSLHLKLPPAQVLDVVMNPSDVDIFIEEGQWNSQAVANLKNKIKTIAVVNAQSRGLMAQSQHKAEQIFNDFFMAAGFKKVVIDFKEKPASVE